MCLGCIVTFADHTRSVQSTFYLEQVDGCTLNPVVEFSGNRQQRYKVWTIFVKDEIIRLIFVLSLGTLQLSDLPSALDLDGP